MEIYQVGSLIIKRYKVLQAPDPEKNLLVGGMGMVYFCHDTKLDRPVALKFIKPELLSERSQRERFLSEGKAWIDLGYHPNIVRCYDVKNVDPTLFLVLELIDKEQGMENASLRSWLDRVPLPLEQALLFSLQIARGMQYATDKIHGLVHRDLKPENILIGADKVSGTIINRVRVTDFGLVKLVGDGTFNIKEPAAVSIKQHPIQYTQNAGTSGYMAPEQIEGNSPGMYTDIYALGCILHEMLTLQRGNPQIISQDLPKPVRDFLRRSLAADPKDRPQTWTEVISLLEELSSEFSVRSLPQENELEEEIAERKSMASSYNAMGVSYAQMGQMPEAFHYFETALNIFQEVKDRQGEGAVSGNLGNTYARTGRMKEALYYCEQDLAIARELHDRPREGLALGNIGELYRNAGMTKEAIDFYEKRLAIVREANDPRGEGNALSSLGLAYTILGEVEKAISYFEQQLSITRKIGDQRGEGNALCNLGNVYAQQQKWKVALDHYVQYRKISHTIGDWMGEGNAWGNTGNVYLSLGNIGDAIDCYEMRLEIEHKNGDKRREGSALGCLGNAYAKCGDVENALFFYEQQLGITRELNDLVGLAIVSGNLANLYKHLGNSAQALAFAQDSVRIFTQLRDIPNAQRAQKLIDQISKK